KPNEERSRRMPVKSGGIAAARLRGTLVTLEAAMRSSGGTRDMTYACLAGTSICDIEARRRRKATARGALGTTPAASRKRLAGRWVQTIVGTRPMRAAGLPERNCEGAATIPAPRTIDPA